MVNIGKNVGGVDYDLLVIGLRNIYEFWLILNLIYYNRMMEEGRKEGGKEIKGKEIEREKWREKNDFRW